MKPNRKIVRIITRGTGAELKYLSGAVRNIIIMIKFVEKRRLWMLKSM